MNYMSNRHKNNKFSFETEKTKFLCFVNVEKNIYREKFVEKKITDNKCFRKDTFSSVHTNFSSF